MPTLLLTLLRRPPPPRTRDPRAPGHRVRPTEPAPIAAAAIETCFGPLARLR
ncbi:MAG TPA: hypothetical protein VMV41_17030 [Cellulomonadaceae bacterium]|nr:hypothetical protein [Cellulomonadaceae bacterium]